MSLLNTSKFYSKWISHAVRATLIDTNPNASNLFMCFNGQSSFSYQKFRKDKSQFLWRVWYARIHLHRVFDGIQCTSLASFIKLWTEVTGFFRNSSIHFPLEDFLFQIYFALSKLKSKIVIHMHIGSIQILEICLIKRSSRKNLKMHTTYFNPFCNILREERNIISYLRRSSSVIGLTYQ